MAYKTDQNIDPRTEHNNNNTFAVKDTTKNTNN